jgi:hypothetical protein
MKISDFRPAIEGDYPQVKDPKTWKPTSIFEMIGPVQKTVKDLVRLSQKLIGLDNLNEDIIQVDLTPDVESTIEVKGINGLPKGAWPILVDYAGSISGWRVEIVDATHLRVKLTVTPAYTSAVTTRIWIKGG